MLFTLLSASSHGDRARADRILDSYCERIGISTWTMQCREEALEVIRFSIALEAGKHTRVACLETKGFKNKSLVVRWIVGTPGWVLRDGELRFATRRFARVAAQRGRPAFDRGLLIDLRKIVNAAGLSHDAGKNTELFEAKILATKSFRQLTGARPPRDPARHENISVAALQCLRSNPIATFQDILNDAITNKPRLTMNLGSAGLRSTAGMLDWAIASHHALPQDGLSLEGQRRNDAEELHGVVERDGLDAREANGLATALRHTRALSSKSSGDEVTALCAESLSIEAGLDAAGGALLTVNAPRMIGLMIRSALILSDHYVSGLQRGVNAGTDAPPRLSSFAARLTEILVSNRRGQQGVGRAIANPSQTLVGHQRAVGAGASSYLKHVLAPGAMRQWLPSLTPTRIADHAGRQGRFAWQGHAVDAVQERMRLAPAGQPIFVAVVCSTGSGKTAGCAALGCLLGAGRFTTALNLRTLTLQTGGEYRSRFGLSNSEVAVLIGSKAHKQLHDAARDEPGRTDELTLEIAGGLQRLPDFLRQHLKGKNASGYLATPVLVTTVDNIISAGDLRRKKWIPPLLRVADGCLVLDEVDQYDVADIPALCRLIFVVGLMGQSIVCSSATLYPAIAGHLYGAFMAGHVERQELLRAERGSDASSSSGPDFALVSDEPGLIRVETGTTAIEFNKHYVDFCLGLDARVRERAATGGVHKLSEVMALGEGMEEAYRIIAAKCLEMHDRHRCDSDGVGVSVGLVRFARVVDVLRFADRVQSMTRHASDTMVAVVPYHSKLLLAVRNHVERRLNTMLKRGDDPMAPLLVPEVKRRLADCKARGLKKLCIVVVASPVEEVGQDHDADWAIVEPSSSRSVIQCAGRVQRHRRQLPATPNIAVMEVPMRVVENPARKGAVFSRPGFETAIAPFPRLSMDQLAPWTSNGFIHAGPCLNPDRDVYGELSYLESQTISSRLHDDVEVGFLKDVGAFFHERHMKQHVFRADANDGVDYFVNPWVRDNDGDFEIRLATSTSEVVSDRFEQRTLVSKESLLLAVSLDDLADDLAAELGRSVETTAERLAFAAEFFGFKVNAFRGSHIDASKTQLDVVAGFSEVTL